MICFHPGVVDARIRAFSGGHLGCYGQVHFPYFFLSSALHKKYCPSPNFFPPFISLFFFSAKNVLLQTFSFPIFLLHSNKIFSFSKYFPAFPSPFFFSAKMIFSFSRYFPPFSSPVQQKYLVIFQFIFFFFIFLPFSGI